MAVSEGFKDFVRDLLADFGPVAIRNMFSGAGVYADGVMFAILAGDTLYLKTDAVSAFAYASEGMTPFKYRPAGKDAVAMSYWEVPPRLLEEAGGARSMGAGGPSNRPREQGDIAARAALTATACREN